MEERPKKGGVGQVGEVNGWRILHGGDHEREGQLMGLDGGVGVTETG